MLGYAVLAAGALLIWVAATGKADKFFAALNVQLPGTSDTSTSTNSGGDTSTSSGSSGNSTDIGTHMGIDANGNIVVINKAIAQMTNAEKDAANAFGRQFPDGQ